MSPLSGNPLKKPACPFLEIIGLFVPLVGYTPQELMKVREGWNLLMPLNLILPIRFNNIAQVTGYP
jgi:hypothetical protein